MVVLEKFIAPLCPTELAVSFAQSAKVVMALVPFRVMRAFVRNVEEKVGIMIVQCLTAQMDYFALHALLVEAKVG